MLKENLTFCDSGVQTVRSFPFFVVQSRSLWKELAIWGESIECAEQLICLILGTRVEAGSLMKSMACLGWGGPSAG